ncbi:MAG: hypothetical protein Q8P24_11775 [Desulfobacterales bacterium]|nr:hypothetical protein [Desulfobacterales bacterium]
MRNFVVRISLFFAAGGLGGLFNSLAVWLLGLYGVTQSFGVAIAPALSPQWLYPRVVWGGIWGIAFFLPVLSKHILIKGLLLSLGPTLIQLFVVFPLKAHKGVMGVDLGSLTPVFVLIFNAVWGLTAAIWLRLNGQR